ncbi:MAG: hypothetical protein DHS20C18_33690 [Saprospiraceae bacterium]|nr:MAG: hypothetical protein DHS20C18_33690 [Saprospiraceae bacterium]
MPDPQFLTTDFLQTKRQIADPLADETIALIVEQEGPEAARKLFDLLIRRIEMPLEELPPATHAFVAATHQLPAWADWKKVELAHDLFLDHGPKFLIFLYYKSLPILYSMANGARVLVNTSRLTNKEQDLSIFARRIAETGQFLLDVMRKDALKPGGIGIQSIQKVRLIHAAIRHFIPVEHWNAEEWGQPINQEDLAATLMTFSVSTTDALAQFNIDEAPERLEAYLHTWTAIGEVLGIQNELLPADRASGRQLLETILAHQSAPSESGALLTQSLLQFSKSTMPSQRLERLPELLLQFLIGRERAQLLGVNYAPGCLGIVIPEAISAYFRWGERLEDKLEEPLGIFINEISRQLSKGMVRFFDRYKGRNFEIPEEFGKVWF